jgi:hypothetical protein
MKIRKETRKHFKDGEVVLFLLKGGEKAQKARHSFLDMKRTALVLRSFQEIQDSERDLDCGKIELCITQKSNSPLLNSRLRLFSAALYEYCLVFPKRDNAQFEEEYSIKTDIFIKNYHRFFFDFFSDFALKINTIKPKVISISFDVNSENTQLKFVCE